MKRLVFILWLCALLPGPAAAGWWAENDYGTGSNGFKKDSLTVFTDITRGMLAGAGGAFYRDTAGYREKVYSFRLPVLYTAKKHIYSLTPFLYPVSPAARSGAKGFRAYVQTSLTEPGSENYFYLTGAAALAGQTAKLAGLPGKKDFTETALEVQAEKSYYGQFYLLASLAAFSKSGAATNGNLVTPALDHSEMAYLGTFRQVTALPDWVATAQITRNMKPEYASHLYIGYSKISFRQAPGANSVIGGMKLELSPRTTLDLAYNFFKMEDATCKNYYKILLRTVF